VKIIKSASKKEEKMTKADEKSSFAYGKAFSKISIAQKTKLLKNNMDLITNLTQDEVKSMSEKYCPTDIMNDEECYAALPEVGQEWYTDGRVVILENRRFVDKCRVSIEKGLLAVELAKLRPLSSHMSLSDRKDRAGKMLAENKASRHRAEFYRIQNLITSNLGAEISLESFRLTTNRLNDKVHSFVPIASFDTGLNLSSVYYNLILGLYPNARFYASDGYARRAYVVSDNKLVAMVASLVRKQEQ